MSVMSIISILSGFMSLAATFIEVELSYWLVNLVVMGTIMLGVMIVSFKKLVEAFKVLHFKLQKALCKQRKRNATL